MYGIKIHQWVTIFPLILIFGCTRFQVKTDYHNDFNCPYKEISVNQSDPKSIVYEANGCNNTVKYKCFSSFFTPFCSQIVSYGNGTLSWSEIRTLAKKHGSLTMGCPVEQIAFRAEDKKTHGYFEAEGCHKKIVYSCIGRADETSRIKCSEGSH